MTAPHHVPTVPDDRDAGFTLIELLVVMIIIGILAAIAIPTFLNQRKNGWNSATKTDVSNLALAVESSAADRGGDFRNVFMTNVAGTPLVLGGGLQAATVTGVEFQGTQNVDLVLASAATPSSFCLVGSNTSFGAAPAEGWWTYSKSKGGLQSSSGMSLADAQARC